MNDQSHSPNRSAEGTLAGRTILAIPDVTCGPHRSANSDPPAESRSSCGGPTLATAGITGTIAEFASLQDRNQADEAAMPQPADLTNASPDRVSRKEPTSQIETRESSPSEPKNSVSYTEPAILPWGHPMQRVGAAVVGLILVWILWGALHRPQTQATRGIVEAESKQAESAEDLVPSIDTGSIDMGNKGAPRDPELELARRTPEDASTEAILNNTDPSPELAASQDLAPPVDGGPPQGPDELDADMPQIPSTPMETPSTTVADDATATAPDVTSQSSVTDSNGPPASIGGPDSGEASYPQTDPQNYLFPPGMPFLNAPRGSAAEPPTYPNGASSSTIRAATLGQQIGRTSTGVPR